MPFSIFNAAMWEEGERIEGVGEGGRMVVEGGA
jgi:hypothetical protein